MERQTWAGCEGAGRAATSANMNQLEKRQEAGRHPRLPGALFFQNERPREDLGV